MKSRLLLALCLGAAPSAAHMVSISTGELHIEGPTARYELRMPLYELEHVADPARTLFEVIRLRGEGAEARRVSLDCREVPEDGAFVCRAVYEFASIPDQVQVKCRLHSVTVPNHVHVLRAYKEDRSDRAVFDFTFPTADINFDPPGPWEVALRQAGAGLLRATGGPAVLLLLLATAVAARTRCELILLAGMLMAGQVVSCTLPPLSGWSPGPNLVEALSALAIAYLAVETLLLPQAGMRWIVVGVLGIFLGQYFALFIAQSGYRTAYVLTGVAMAEAAVLVVFFLVLTQLDRLGWAARLRKGAAALLAIVGLVWFFVRLT